MLTPQDVRSVQFEKNLRGYRTEEVDRFLDKVEEQLTQSENEAEALRKQIADLTAENQKLRQEMKDYEADGDMLKSALINAQRRRSCTVQISAVMMSSVMPTSCCRKPVTARTRSSTRQTRKSWPRSASTTGCAWK